MTYHHPQNEHQGSDVLRCRSTHPSSRGALLCGNPFETTQCLALIAKRRAVELSRKVVEEVVDANKMAPSFFKSKGLLATLLVCC